MGMVGQKGRELLERFCERMTCRIPSTCGWDIVGTWHTGQRRSRADCCGELNSEADLGKRSGPAVLEESAVLLHGRDHRFETCHAHHPKPQVTRLSARPVAAWGPHTARWGRAGAAAPSPAGR